MPQDYLRLFYHAVVHALALVGVAFVLVFVGMEFEWFTVRGSIAERNAFFASAIQSDAMKCTIPCPIESTSEWATVLAGLSKDAAVVKRVSTETGVPPEMIAAVALPEQLRFFTSEREVFKRVFEPLKILGAMSQFSLGISGIKPDAAIDIERRAPNSLKPLLAYKPDEKPNDARYLRLTDAHDHYYQWLYTALYIRIVEDEWNAAGFPIQNNPGVVATLYNIGLARSKPNATPEVGGAVIEVGGTSYTYGEIAQTIFTSPEIAAVFQAKK